MGDNMVAANAEVNRCYNEEVEWTSLKTTADLAVNLVKDAEDAVAVAQRAVVEAKNRASSALLDEALARVAFEKKWKRPPEPQMKWANCKGE